MEKIYSITELKDYTLYMYRSKHLLVNVSNTKEFVQIPSSIQVRCENSQVIFYSKEEFISEFKKFINVLNTFLSDIEKEPFVKRIKIRGLGYKMTRDSNTFVVSLGFSRPVRIEVPLKISNIVIKKKIISIQSFDKMFLGNFASMLCSLKKRDIYKGKGFSLEYKTQKLKIIKKK